MLACGKVAAMTAQLYTFFLPRLKIIHRCLNAEPILSLKKADLEKSNWFMFRLEPLGDRRDSTH